MNKTHKHAIQIIIVSAVLVAILFNIQLILYVLKNLEIQRFSDMDDGMKMRVYIGGLNFVFNIIFFCIAAFFNYSWKDKLIPPGIVKTGRVLLIITANLLLFYVTALLESSLLRYLSERLAGRFTTQYFLFENISIIGLAVSEAYFIILFKKIKTAELENIRLREKKSNAELAALKEQISPHFFSIRSVRSVPLFD